MKKNTFLHFFPENVKMNLSPYFFFLLEKNKINKAFYVKKKKLKKNNSHIHNLKILFYITIKLSKSNHSLFWNSSACPNGLAFFLQGFKNWVHWNIIVESLTGNEDFSVNFLLPSHFPRWKDGESGCSIGNEHN